MSPSQPSKQKRAQQNRNQRAALQQRKAAATAAATSSSGSSASGGGGGGLFGRLRNAGGARPAATGGGGGGASARPTAAARGGAGGGGLFGGGAARGDQPPGYRAALVGLLTAVAGLVVCITLVRVPVDGNGDVYSRERLAAEWTDSALQVAVANPDAPAAEVADDVEVWSPDREEELYAAALWPASLGLALPAIASFFGFRAVSRRRPSRIVNRAMFATLLGAFLSFQPILFLPAVIGIGIASFQIRKAEVQAIQEAQAADPDRLDEDDVIDAEVVDDDAAPADDGGTDPADPDAR